MVRGAARRMLGTNNPEDERLVELLSLTAKGDRQAFGRLYDDTSAKLHGVALRLVKRRDLAEDAVQEAYLQIWYNAKVYRAERGAPIAWLVGIVRYRALDRLRHGGPDRAADPIDVPDRWADPGPTPLEETLRSAEQRVLILCLGKLDERWRQCIILAFYEGFTHAELSNKLDTPLGTVKSWIRRGAASR